MIPAARPIDPEFRRQIRFEARESLHATWATAELEYFRARNGVLFAGVFRGNPLLLAADPIYDGDPAKLAEGLADLLREFPRARSLAFAGVSARLLAAIPRRYAVQAIQIGHEPWIDLAAHEPRGNRGRGIRSARNRALRAGVRVARIDGFRIARAGSDERRRIAGLLAAWRNQGMLEIGGFLQPVDPFHDAANRFYFVARDRRGEWVGFLAATRIGETRSILLEDLVLDPRAEDGTGELLTLEALRHFSEKGFAEASLGAVSLTRVASHPDFPPSRAVGRALSAFLRFVRLFYNAEGIELFRKRFPVRDWSPLHLGIARVDGVAPGGAEWTGAILALLLAHRPRLAISPDRIGAPLARTIRRWAVPMACALVLAFFFLAHVPKRAHAAHRLLFSPILSRFDAHHGRGDNRRR